MQIELNWFSGHGAWLRGRKQGGRFGEACWSSGDIFNRRQLTENIDSSWHKLVCDLFRMAYQEIEEDGEMNSGDWTPVANWRRGTGANRRGVLGWMLSQGSKRSLEENSSDEGSEFVRKRAFKRR